MLHQVTTVMYVFALIPRMRSTCYLQESVSMSPAVASSGDSSPTQNQTMHWFGGFCRSHQVFDDTTALRKCILRGDITPETVQIRSESKDPYI